MYVYLPFAAVAVWLLRNVYSDMPGTCFFFNLFFFAVLLLFFFFFFFLFFHISQRQAGKLLEQSAFLKRKHKERDSLLSVKPVAAFSTFHKGGFAESLLFFIEWTFYGNRSTCFACSGVSHLTSERQ